MQTIFKAKQSSLRRLCKGRRVKAAGFRGHEGQRRRRCSGPKAQHGAEQTIAGTRCRQKPKGRREEEMRRRDLCADLQGRKPESEGQSFT